MTNPRIDPLSLDRYSQDEGRIDTHALCLPSQKSWATYYDTAGGTLWRLPVTNIAQRDSCTEALDTDEGRKVTERGREQGETESQYSEISNVPSRLGSSYALVADITGAILPEMALSIQNSNLTDVGVPTQSRLVFRGVTPGEGMAIDALTEGFFGQTTIVPPTVERTWRRTDAEDITTFQSMLIPTTPGPPTPSEVVPGAIEQALMPMNRRSHRVDITMPPHVERRAEILWTLDQYSATIMQPCLTTDPQAMQTFFPLPPSIGGTYIAPSNDLEREAYQNAAVISQLAGTTHMTSGVTPSRLPHIEDDVVTEAPSVSIYFTGGNCF